MHKLLNSKRFHHILSVSNFIFMRNCSIRNFFLRFPICIGSCHSQLDGTEENVEEEQSAKIREKTLKNVEVVNLTVVRRFILNPC